MVKNNKFQNDPLLLIETIPSEKQEIIQEVLKTIMFIIINIYNDII